MLRICAVEITATNERGENPFHLFARRRQYSSLLTEGFRMLAGWPVRNAVLQTFRQKDERAPAAYGHQCRLAGGEEIAVESGADPNALLCLDEGCALAAARSREQMERSIRLGADKNASIGSTGWRPLMVAARLGKSDHLRWLLELEADPMLGDGDGNYPITLLQSRRDCYECQSGPLVQPFSTSRSPGPRRGGECGLGRGNQRAHPRRSWPENDSRLKN